MDGQLSKIRIYLETGGCLCNPNIDFLRFSGHTNIRRRLGDSNECVVSR